MYNAELHALFSNYESKMNKFCETWSNRLGYKIKIQYPLLEIGDFENNRKKNNPDKRAIMFIGQMPGKWESKSQNIIEGMKHTDQIITENWYGSSPFFQFTAQITSDINGISKENSRFCYYWTNIFRFATDDSETTNKLKNNDSLLNDYLNNINTLPEEIKIVNPDVIIFLTGHNYDKYLQKIFLCTFCSIQTCDGIDNINYFSKVIADNLPRETFRIDHPHTLKFSGKLKQKSLIKSIKALI